MQVNFKALIIAPQKQPDNKPYAGQSVESYATEVRQ